MTLILCCAGVRLDLTDAVRATVFFAAQEGGCCATFTLAFALLIVDMLPIHDLLAFLPTRCSTTMSLPLSSLLRFVGLETVDAEIVLEFMVSSLRVSMVYDLPTPSPGDLIETDSRTAY
eukprot:SAG31_NODE_8618_length_1419_cov_1.115909_2_plen_119_part_00